MKKIFFLAILLVMAFASFSPALAAPGSNPNGVMIQVDCGFGLFDVWVPNGYTAASFDPGGGVGISKAIYLNTGSGYELVWGVPGNGVFKNTVWCEWELDGLQWAGEILTPPFH